MRIEREAGTYILECNGCGDSWLGRPIQGAGGIDLLHSKKDAAAFARALRWRNDIVNGWGLLCRDCYRQRATL